MDIYPYKMVPYVGLSKDKSIDDLLKNGNFAIARRIDLSEEDAGIHRVGSVSLLGRDSLGAHHVYNFSPNLSVTILGVGATLHDCAYRQTVPGNKDWNGDMIFVKDYVGCVEVKNPCIQLVYAAANLHNQPAQYNKRFQKESEAKAELNLMEKSPIDMTVKRWFDSSTSYPLTGKIFLRREPTMLNFWHVVLVLQMINGKEIRNITKDVMDNLVKEPKAADSFALYVLDNYLLKNFTVNTLPFDTGLTELDFLDENISEEVRMANSTATKEAFKSTPIVM